MICILNGYENTLSDQIINEEFGKLVTEKRMYMKVINVLATTLLVELYDPETSENIKTKLVGLQCQKQISSVNTSQQIKNGPMNKNFDRYYVFYES